jgi:acyl carrier protein/NRPS condensation-like uncharacterized protein
MDIKYKPKKFKKLDKKNIADLFALTPMQEGMLFHFLKEPGSTLHVEQLSLKISGEVNRGLFMEAWNEVVKANEMLRTVFRWEETKKPVQIVLNECSFQPGMLDLCNPSGGVDLEELKSRERNLTLDLQEVPFRVTLCNLEERLSEMIITHHHILYDGWSSAIILREFLEAYDRLVKKEETAAPEKAAFKDYVHWLRDKESADKEKQEEFWKKYLEGFMGTPGIGEAFREGLWKTGSAAAADRMNYRFKLPAALDRQLKEFAGSTKVPLAVLLYSAWGLLMTQYNSSDDLLFDITAAGRTARLKGIENSVGLFIGTMPMRIRTKPDRPVKEWLSQIDNTLRTWEEYANQVPVRVKEKLDHCGTGTVFDSVVVIENYPLGERLTREGHLYSLVPRMEGVRFSGRTPHDITCIITLHGGIELILSYHAGLFDLETIEQLMKDFSRAAEALSKDSTSALSSVLSIFRENRGETIARILSRKQEEFRRYSADDVGPGSEVTAPRDAVEESLVEVWSEVLNTEGRQIGIDTDFFRFGGHSLKANILAAKLHKALNVKVPLSEIFKRPTIRELAAYIKKSVKESYSTIGAAEKRSYYPLSSVQQRLYALHRLDPESMAYNVTAVITLEGEMEKDYRAIFQQAFKVLIRRHEILRTAFPEQAGNGAQKVYPPGEIEFVIEKIEHSIENFIRPFDLTRAPLMRAGYFMGKDREHKLILDMHHIITDGFSMSLLIRELTAVIGGETLPPVKYQYKDFSQWQTRRLAKGELKQQEAYWLERLSGELPQLDLLTDFPRPAVMSFAGKRLRIPLPDRLYHRLEQLAAASGATLFMVLIAALNVLLSRYTGQEDIIIGTTTAGREHADLETIAGLFIETLVMRNAPQAGLTFAQFLKSVKSNTLDAFENQEYPFRELIRQKGDAKEMSRNPLFNVMLIMQNIDMPPIEIGGITFLPREYRIDVSKLDITFEVYEGEYELRLELEFGTALFKQDTIMRMGRHFVNILEEVVEQPGVLLSEIVMLDEKETRQLLEDFRDTMGEGEESRRHYLEPQEVRIHKLFERQAAKRPNGIAIQHEDQQLTYKELNKQADLLAALLKEL